MRCASRLVRQLAILSRALSICKSPLAHFKSAADLGLGKNAGAAITDPRHSFRMATAITAVLAMLAKAVILAIHERSLKAGLPESRRFQDVCGSVKVTSTLVWNMVGNAIVAIVLLQAQPALH